MITIIPWILENWKIGLMLIFALVFVVFMGFRGCNQLKDKINNETIPIDQPNNPDPSVFDSICLQFGYEGCKN